VPTPCWVPTSSLCPTRRKTNGAAPRRAAATQPPAFNHSLASPHQRDSFRNSPLVTGPMGVRFYAGAPLTVNDVRVGSICIVDKRPRQLTSEQLMAIRLCAAQVRRVCRLSSCVCVPFVATRPTDRCLAVLLRS
jgi:hypothetical protein